MEGYVFLLSHYWRQLAGCVLTLAGCWMLLAGPGQDSTVHTFGLMLFAIGWMCSVFGFFTWPSPCPGDLKRSVRVNWPGLFMVVIAAVLPVASDANHREWSQLHAEAIGVIGILAFATAARGISDMRSGQ